MDGPLEGGAYRTLEIPPRNEIDTPPYRANGRCGFPRNFDIKASPKLRGQGERNNSALNLVRIEVQHTFPHILFDEAGGSRRMTVRKRPFGLRDGAVALRSRERDFLFRKAVDLRSGIQKAEHGGRHDHCKQASEAYGRSKLILAGHLARSLQVGTFLRHNSACTVHGRTRRYDNAQNVVRTCLSLEGESTLNTNPEATIGSRKTKLKCPFLEKIPRVRRPLRDFHGYPPVLSWRPLGGTVPPGNSDSGPVPVSDLYFQGL